MRAILFSAMVGALLCLTGCEGGSSQTVLPKNPTPPPKNGPKAVGTGASASGSQAPATAPAKKL
jgi:hypothetical protein